MPTPSTTILLRDIEAYLTRTGMSATAFGVAAMGDRHLLRRLRSGRGIRLDTADKIRAFMARPTRGVRRKGSQSAPAVAA